MVRMNRANVGIPQTTHHLLDNGGFSKWSLVISRAPQLGLCHGASPKNECAPVVRPRNLGAQAPTLIQFLWGCTAHRDRQNRLASAPRTPSFSRASFKEW